MEKEPELMSPEQLGTEYVGGSNLDEKLTQGAEVRVRNLKTGETRKGTYMGGTGDIVQVQFEGEAGLTPVPRELVTAYPSQEDLKALGEQIK